MTSTSGTAASEPPQILIEVDVRSADRVAVVTFRRGSHNYLSYDLVTELAETFEDVAYQGCRSVVLRTDGRHFCAGADFRRPASRETGRDIFDVVPRLFRAPIPVVAALTGASVGGGMGLALAADFRVMSSSAYLMANFTRLGISHGFALSSTLPRLVGAQRAAEILYVGKPVHGPAAVEMGLCDRLAEPHLVGDVAYEIAKDIAMSSPSAVAAARRILRRDLVAEIEQTLALEREEQMPLMASSDFAEGVRAWKEKREPSFRDTAMRDRTPGLA